MRLGRAALCICVLGALSCMGPKGPLPPGFENLKLQGSVAELKQLRPSVHVDGQERMFDPVNLAAFVVKDNKVQGIRFFIGAPTDKLVLTYYKKNFQTRRTKGGISYLIDGHRLKIYKVEKGIEVIYGQDPGSSLSAIGTPKDASKKENKNSTPGFLLRSRSPTVLDPPHYPVQRTSNGIDIWLHPLGEPLNKPVSLEIVIGTGSSDELDSNRGSSAVVGSLALQRVLALARQRHVEISQVCLRSAMIFGFNGLADDVSMVAQTLAKELVARATASTSDKQVNGAFASSLRQAMGTTLNPRLLADEGFGAIFASSPFSPSPISRSYEPPNIASVKQRAAQMNKAPARILVAGAIGPRYAFPIAEALGQRPADTRQRMPRPSLPNRESRKVSNPAIAIDGLWIDTSSIAQIAKLYIAQAILEREATKELRFIQGLNEKPLYVAAGGQISASYLMSISAARGIDAQAIGLASRSIMSRLPKSVPNAEALETIKQGTVAHLNRQWASPKSAVRLMYDLTMLGVESQWLPQIKKAILGVSEHELRAFLVSHVIAENTFSVRWGPNQ